MIKRFASCGIPFLITLLGTFIHANTAWPQGFQVIEHFPVTRAQQGNPIKITAQLRQTNSFPLYVRVYFKSIHEQRYRHFDLQRNLNAFVGEIPGKFVQPPVIQYFILALYPNQKVVSLPAMNPYGQPFEVAVQEGPSNRPSEAAPGEIPQPPSAQRSQRGSGQQTPPTAQTQGMQPPAPDRGESQFSIQIISPEPFEQVDEKEVVIAASFVGDAEGADSASVRVTLDGEEVTHLAQISNFVVTFAPANLPAGSHTVVVWANDHRGKLISPAKWEFEVTGKLTRKEKKPKSYQGRVYAEFRQEKFSGQTLGIKNLGANIGGKSGPFTYQGMVYITSLESSRLQPRNRFVLNLESKLLDIGVGDVYPYLNDLVLWGRRVRGFSGHLKLGLINFQLIFGQTNRLIKPIYTGGVGGSPRILAAKGAYRQNLTAGRVSFGSGKNFQLGLLALKARDDSNSLSVNESNSNPKDNLVAGADLLVALNAHRFELRASAAYSILTNDISNGPASKATIDSIFGVNLPFDPADFKNIIILNESTIPLDPTGLSSLAYQGSLTLNYFRNAVQIGYKRLGPEYNSLGQTYLRNNIKGFYINDRIALFRNKVYTTIGYEDFKDNFGKEVDTLVVSLRTINFGVAIYPGPNLPTINISTRNYLRDNGVDQFFTQTSSFGIIDTTDIREQSLTRDISVNLTYNFTAMNLQHNATVSVINSKLIDQFGSNRPTTVAPKDFSTTVQMISLKTQYEKPLTTTLTFASNQNHATRGLSTINFKLLTGRADYKLMQNKLSVYGGVRYITASGLQKSSSTVTLASISYKQQGVQIGGIYQPTPHHNFMVDFELIKYTDKGGTFNPVTGAFTPNPSFTNSIIRLFYEYRL
ncbi:MAG: hypothetical protein D6814_07850 [Calditrichaeota bacterium]|nr:MAG: hypothetical protein D6814_07850 [Calditrichota bacterium]